MVEVRQGSKEHYNTILYGPTRCKRKKDKNNRIYYETKFPRQTFYIFDNKFYKQTIKEYKDSKKDFYLSCSSSLLPPPLISHPPPPLL